MNVKLHNCFPVTEDGIDDSLMLMADECGGGVARAMSLDYAFGMGE